MSEKHQNQQKQQRENERSEDRIRELEEALRLQAKELNAVRHQHQQLQASVVDAVDDVGSPMIPTATAFLSHERPLTSSASNNYYHSPQNSRPPTPTNRQPSLSRRSSTLGTAHLAPVGSRAPTPDSNNGASPMCGQPSPPVGPGQGGRFSAMLNAMQQHETATQVQSHGLQHMAPQVIGRYKIVLLGHEEVGKTSLRKCLLSDPLFFKSLPDVTSTTCIEAQSHDVPLPPDPSLRDDAPNEMHLRILDFAGQEDYNIQSIFLSNRTLYCFVWDMSTLVSGQMSEYEQMRLHTWLDDIYAKAPSAALMLIGTHLDELRDQSSIAIRNCLEQAARVVKCHVSGITKSIVLEGNFAVSSKSRVVYGNGLHKEKFSSLLLHMAKVARKLCVCDPIFFNGAIPARYLTLVREIQQIASLRKKIMLPISDYVSIAARHGIVSEVELLDASQLYHSWLILFLFNQSSVNANPFIFLHPHWLSRIVSNLFSFSHLLHTPVEMREKIGGIDFDESAALRADPNGMVGYGVFLPRLTSVLFRHSLSELLQRDPVQEDFDMCLQLLIALEVVYVQTAQRRGLTITTHYIPSLLPHDAPPKILLDTLHFLFSGQEHTARRRVFKSNVFPKELCFRLQCRLSNMIRHVGLESIPTVKGSAWRYAAWLGSGTLTESTNNRAMLWFSSEYFFSYRL
eukprot:PhM_4_TR15721/c0_g1_i1/m.88244